MNTTDIVEHNGLTNYVGNCIGSFDEDGICTNDALPFNDVTEFAQHVDEYGDESNINGLRITYSSESDTHSFFVR